MSSDEAVDLGIRALFEAADEDSATGGPDLVRRIFPVVATITADGFRAPRRRRAAKPASVPSCERAWAPAGWRPRRHEHALLRRPRAGDEGPGRLRPQGHRPGPQPGRLIYDDGIAIVRREPVSNTLRKVSEIYDRIAFAGVGKYNEFDQLRVAGVRAADLKGYAYSREDVDARSLANQYAQILGQVFTHEMKPMEVEILVAEVGARAGERPAVPHPLRRHGDGREPLHRAGRREPRPSPSASRSRMATACGLADALTAAVGALAGPDRTPHRRRPRGGRAVAATASRRAFRRIAGDELAGLLPCGGPSPRPAAATRASSGHADLSWRRPSRSDVTPVVSGRLDRDCGPSRPSPPPRPGPLTRTSAVARPTASTTTGRLRRAPPAGPVTEPTGSSSVEERAPPRRPAAARRPPPGRPARPAPPPGRRGRGRPRCPGAATGRPRRPGGRPAAGPRRRSAAPWPGGTIGAAGHRVDATADPAAAGADGTGTLGTDPHRAHRYPVGSPTWSDASSAWRTSTG